MDAIINSIKDRLEREQEERALAGRRRELCTALRDCAAYVGQRAHDDRGNETFYWDIDEDEQPEVFLERTGRLESIQVIEARAPGTWSAVNIELARTWVSAHWLAAERIIVELGQVQAVHELKPDADVFQPAYSLFCKLLESRDLDGTASALAAIREKLGDARYVISGYFSWLADQLSNRWFRPSPSEPSGDPEWLRVRGLSSKQRDRVREAVRRLEACPDEFVPRQELRERFGIPEKTVDAYWNAHPNIADRRGGQSKREPVSFRRTMLVQMAKGWTPEVQAESDASD